MALNLIWYNPKHTPGDIFMKIMKRNVRMNILLVFIIILSEIYINDMKSGFLLYRHTNSHVCLRAAGTDLPEPSGNTSAFCVNGDTDARRDICTFGRLAAIPCRGIIGDIRQCRGRNQRKAREKIYFFYLFLIGHLKFSQFYFTDPRRKFRTAVAYCKGIIIRYIHHQDGKPPCDCFP